MKLFFLENNKYKDKIFIFEEKKLLGTAKRYKVVSEILTSIKDIKVNGNIKLFLDSFYTPSFNYAKNDASVGVLSVLPKFSTETKAFVGVITMMLFFNSNNHFRH